MAGRVRIYAGTRDGLQILTLQGKSVDLLSAVFPDEIIQAVIGCREQPERVFVGLRDGVHRSDDAGGHWENVLSGDIRSLTVDPSDDRVLYAGTDPVGLYRSEDGGTTWEELSSLLKLPEETHEKLGEWEPSDMALHFDESFRHRRQNWWFQEPPYLGHVLQIFVDPDDANLIMLSIEHGGVARSTDRGRTWDDISGGIDYLDIHCVTNVPNHTGRSLVTSARGLYATSNPTIGWTRSEEGCDRDYFHPLTFLPAAKGENPTVIVGTADGSPGVWRRNRRGARGALYRSVDCGVSWQRIGVGNVLPEEMESMVWAICVHPDSQDTIVAAVGDSSNVPARNRSIGAGSVILSDDAGESWMTLKDGMPAVEQLFLSTV